jgi:hypothetical protein
MSRYGFPIKIVRAGYKQELNSSGDQVQLGVK